MGRRADVTCVKKVRETSSPDNIIIPQDRFLVRDEQPFMMVIRMMGRRMTGMAAILPSGLSGGDAVRSLDWRT